jgi:hypothetical protein
MNSVSWFLYLADAMSSLSGVIVFFGVMATLLTCLGIFMTLLNTDSSNTDRKQRYADYNANGARFIRSFSPWMVLCFVVAAIIPAQKTMYAIAASQVGEQVVKSEAVQGVANDAAKALQIWIKKQIEPDKKS